MAKSQHKPSVHQRTNPAIDKSWLDLRRHQDGKIKTPYDLIQDMKHPPNFNRDILDRIQGSMIGLALGDAVGAHVEFRPYSFVKDHPVTELKGGGTWGLKAGQFTDDTSMALCLANSLIVRQDFMPYDQLVRYKWWHRQGYMSSTGECFDIGAATRNSLNEFERRQKEFVHKHPDLSLNNMDSLSDPQLLREFNVLCGGSNAAGNGALMRLAPVPLFFYRFPKFAVEFSGISGQITHGDPSSTDACRYYGALIVAALNGEQKDQLLSKDFYSKHKEWFDEKPLHPKIMEIAQGSFRNYDGHKGGIRGKGYVVESLQAALWAFWSNDNSFEKGALAAVNLGDDTDTTAAIYGQLAGACHGCNKLSTEWQKKLFAEDFILCLSEWIVYEGEKWDPTKSSAEAAITSVVQSAAKTAVNSLNIGQQNPRGSSPSSQKISEQNLEICLEKKSDSASIRSTSADLAKYTNEYRDITLRMPGYQADTNNGALDLKKKSSTNDATCLGYLASQNIGLPNAIPNGNSGVTSILADIDLKGFGDIFDLFKYIDKDFVIYVDKFKSSRVDPGTFLRDLDHTILQQYGVNDRFHQEKMLTIAREWQQYRSTWT